MAQIQQTICDNCGKIKGESNHWFKHQLYNDGSNAPCITFTLPVDNVLYDNTWNDYCGQACITAALQQWLNSTYTQLSPAESPNES